MYHPNHAHGAPRQNGPGSCHDIHHGTPPPLGLSSPCIHRRVTAARSLQYEPARSNLPPLSLTGSVFHVVSLLVNTDGHVIHIELEHNAKIAAEIEDVKLIYSPTLPLECKGTRALGECGVAAEALLKEDMYSSCVCCWASRERVLRRRWGSWRPGKEIVQHTCAKRRPSRRQRSRDRVCTRLQGWLLRWPLCEHIVRSLLELDVHF